jgi:predicted metalloprotease with PDZ domain
MEEFVDALVHRPLQPDFESLFEPFGIRLSERRDSTPYLGVQFKSGSTALASVLEGSPAANAGLSPGDEILALDGLRVTSPQWSGLFESVARVDCEVEILLARRGRILTRNVTPSSPPAGQITLVVMPDSTPAQDRLRSSWLFEPSLAGSTLTCTSSQG